MGNKTPLSSDNTQVMRRTHLLVYFPDGEELDFPLELEATRIGRGAAGNDLAIPDDYNSISRKHLVIKRDGNQYMLGDLGSSNGARLNGVLVHEALLKEGDEIRIGLQEAEQEVRIVFHLGYEALPGSSMPSSDFHRGGVELMMDPPASGPYLRIRWSNGQVDFFPIGSMTTRIGRSGESDLQFPPSLTFISRNHAEIRHRDSGFVIVDLGSANGTFLNNQRIEVEKEVPLQNGSIIRIGDENLGASVGLTFYNPAQLQAPVEGFATVAIPGVDLIKRRDFTVGRSYEANIRLDSPDVSRKHALISKEGDVYSIEDLGSLNGTYVNGQRIQKVILKQDDLVQIGDFLLLFKDEELVPYKSQGTRIDILRLSKDVEVKGSRVRILDDINLTIMPGEFIGLVGGSGAGKSTLVNALVGYRPADGQVLLNGMDFYAEYDLFRPQLGYVPQSDILHTSLTVEKALDYAARLRLQADISLEERRDRITSVLETVSMNSPVIRKMRIRDLSGGQRKRVSIAAELLANPQVIYLDEATSGLDPGLEKKMMYTLRRMADEGHTVVLVTHATANIVQTDHVAFLSQGRLVYFGPSQDALGFFDVNEFADVYERIEQNAEEWRKKFQEGSPDYYQKFVVGRQKIPAVNIAAKITRTRFGLRDFFRQLGVLTERTLSVLTSDTFTLFLMLALFPLTATLQLMISTHGILTGDLAILADPVAAARTLMESYIPLPKLNTFIFVMGLEAVLVGMYVPSNELIRDRPVYMRERKVNLKVFPYLLSKAAVFTVLAAVQTLLYLLVLSIGVDLPEQGLYLPGPVELFITLFLTMIAGMGIGFVVSAISRTTDMAIYMLVIFMFFEFFFAGTVFDLRDNPAEPLSYLTATRWSLTAIGVTVDVASIAEGTILCNQVDNPLTPAYDPRRLCFNYPEARQDLMLNYADGSLLESWFMLAGMAVLCMMVTAFLIKRLDKQ